MLPRDITGHYIFVATSIPLYQMVGEILGRNHHDAGLRKASIKHFYCNNKTWNSCMVPGIRGRGVGGATISLTKSLHRTAKGWEGTEGGTARRLWYQQREPSIKNQEMLKLRWPASLSQENTQGCVMMAGLSLGVKSTNSTFILNFRLKFLKFRKWWSLDSYEITKVLKIH